MSDLTFSLFSFKNTNSSLYFFEREWLVAEHQSKNQIYHIRLSNIEWKRTGLYARGSKRYAQIKNKKPSLQYSTRTDGLVKIHKYNGYKLTIHLPRAWLNLGCVRKALTKHSYGSVLYDVLDVRRHYELSANCQINVIVFSIYGAQRKKPNNLIRSEF